MPLRDKIKKKILDDTPKFYAGGEALSKDEVVVTLRDFQIALDTIVKIIADAIEGEEIKFLGRLKLEVDAVVCSCGEPYRDSDLGDMITRRYFSKARHLKHGEWLE
jgi:hypothetical protein